MIDTSAGLDEMDRKILEELQQDASLSIAEIAAKISLSHNASWRRMKRLEEIGVITGRVALLDPETIGLGLTVFIRIKTTDHGAAWADRFSEGVSQIPEVMEFYRLSGDADYLIKVCVSGVADYDRVYRQIADVAPLSDVNAGFALQKIKFTTAYPVRE